MGREVKDVVDSTATRLLRLQLTYSVPAVMALLLVTFSLGSSGCPSESHTMSSGHKLVNNAIKGLSKIMRLVEQLQHLSV